MKCFKCGKDETTISSNTVWACSACHSVNLPTGIYNIYSPITITGAISSGNSGSGMYINSVSRGIDLYDWINDNIKSKTDEALLRFKHGIISANELRDLFTGLLHD
jgi:hypothetical protein